MWVIKLHYTIIFIRYFYLNNIFFTNNILELNFFKDETLSPKNVNIMSQVIVCRLYLQFPTVRVNMFLLTFSHTEIFVLGEICSPFLYRSSLIYKLVSNNLTKYCWLLTTLVKLSPNCNLKGAEGYNRWFVDIWEYNVHLLFNQDASGCW